MIEPELIKRIYFSSSQTVSFSTENDNHVEKNQT